MDEGAVLVAVALVVRDARVERRREVVEDRQDVRVVVHVVLPVRGPLELRKIGRAGQKKVAAVHPARDAAYRRPGTEAAGAVPAPGA